MNHKRAGKKTRDKKCVYGRKHYTLIHKHVVKKQFSRWFEMPVAI